ncbi:MAG TPA: hypothetical protein VFC41_08235 [Anaerovoracaceae bacterium]|nr:hypothetical protein [Anaerovoracaceae bacterium]
MERITLAKLNQQAKKNLLLENFEVLKKDPIKHEEQLAEIIEKMIGSLHELDLGFDMLNWALLNNSKCIQFRGLLCELSENNPAKVAEFLRGIEVKMALRKMYAFGNNEDVSYGCMSYGIGYLYAKPIVYLFSQNEYAEAFDLFDYAFNYYNSGHRFELIKAIIDYVNFDMHNEVQESATEMILSFIEKIESKEERSILITKMIDLM